MRDRIAVIGWGSLIWDLDTLAPLVEPPWAMGAGPRLPLEFSRISPKRKMSLVVVIDPEHGQDCPTSAIASRRARVAEAVEDLALRERAPGECIGAVGDGPPRGAMAARVAAWCAETGARGAVWTDLPRNFEERTGRAFSVAEGIGYLRGLPEDAQAEAKRYIDGAPAATDTPLRRALAQAAWWGALRR